MMGIFDKLLMTDEEKEQARQLNQIGYINALNTHNQELQQKVMTLTAQNAQNQYPEQLGLFLIKIGDRSYYVCEAVAKEVEKLREALKPFARYSDWLIEEEETGNRAKDTDSQPVSIQYLRAAAAAIRESGE